MTHSHTVVAGLDPSLSGFGIAIGAPGLPTHLQTVSTPPATGVRGRVLRYQRLVMPVLDVLRKHDVGLVVVEDYSIAALHSKHSGKAIERIGLAEILRYELARAAEFHAVPVVEVGPTTLKRFARGKGSGPKLIAEVESQWGKRCADDNQADAYALLMLGFMLAGHCDPEQGHQFSVVRTLRAQLAREREAMRVAA